jgi:hypothetical protein
MSDTKPLPEPVEFSEADMLLVERIKAIENLLNYWQDVAQVNPPGGSALPRPMCFENGYPVLPKRAMSLVEMCACGHSADAHYFSLQSHPCGACGCPVFRSSEDAHRGA